MRLRSLLVVASLAGLLVAPSSAHAAGSRSARYLVPSTPGVLNVVNLDPAMPGTGIGGYAFPANGKKPTRIEVVDDSTGLPVAFSACQDLNGDESCDLATEPYATSCDGAKDLPTNFKADAKTTVFVKLIEPVLCENDNQAFQGTITLFHA